VNIGVLSDTQKDRPMASPQTTGKKIAQDLRGLELLTYSQLRALGLPYSRTHLRRLENLGLFPMHINIGGTGAGNIAWFRHEYADYLASRRAERKPVIASSTGAAA
jgi:hypothetical protein